MQSEDKETTDTSSENIGTEWLTRNARELTFDEGSNSHERAKENYMKPQSQVVAVDDVAGRWKTALAGSSRAHDVLLLKSPSGDYAGACDCEGFVKGGHVCAHLWFVRIMESLEDLSVPESSNKYAKVMKESSQATEEPQTMTDRPYVRLVDTYAEPWLFPERVTKQPYGVVCLYGDGSKETYPWHQVREVGEAYDVE